MTQEQKILKMFQPLFAKAEKEGLLFHHMKLKLILTSEELQSLHKNGRFIIDTDNWDLLSPQELLELYTDKRDNAIYMLNEYKEKLYI